MGGSPPTRSIMNLFSRRVLALILMLLGASVLLCLKAIRGAEDKTADEASERKAYADKIRETYNFPFGKDKISLPGNAATVSGDFLQASAFPDAAYCGHCHQEAYHEWRQALHSNAFRTPFYRTSVNILIRTKGIEFARHCDSCHNPIGVLSGALNTGSTLDRSFDRDGLTCATCHSIQSVDTKLGNGSFVMGVPSVLVDEQGKRIPGIVPDAEILAHLDRHAKAVMQDFYHTPEFCSACHKANLPTPLEVGTCNGFLAAEIAAMPRLSGLLALGGTAHNAVLRAHGLRPARTPFRHGAIHALPGQRLLADSYHVSRLNTNTGRLTEAMFQAVVRDLLDRLASPAPLPRPSPAALERGC